MNSLTIAMPTTNSAAVIGETLNRAADALANAGMGEVQLHIVDDDSDDRTTEIAREHALDREWVADIDSEPTTLPEARQRLIDGCDTEWLWFVDDDARVDADYLQRLEAVIGPETGAVQGRKHKRRDESTTDWLQYRARRGGTHATLIRHDAVAGIDIPADLHVLEDEYIRRHVDSSGYAWQFQPHAYFKHDNQDRHSVGFQEGYLGGKYGLSRGTWAALNVPFAAVTGRDTIAHAKQFAGWVAGYRERHRTADDRLAEVAEA
jgi:glycosyltransferase involved in cell wall biosynthesis